MATSGETTLTGDAEVTVEPGPTSWVQDGVWLLEQLAPYRGVHRLVRTWHVHGTIDVPALRSAWRTLLDRHEVLRTRLVEVDGVPQPVVSADTNGAFVHVDLGHLADAERERAVDRVCAAAASVPERATDTPLARLTLVRTGSATHRLVLALHRAVADDRSISIIVDELSICYAAQVRPGPVTPASLAPVLRYAEYARWQRDLVDGPVGRRLLDWWTAHLTPLPPPVPLPVDHDGATRPAGPAGLVPFDWGTALADQLATYCRTRSATPAAVLLAAVQAVLHRYGDDDRVTVAMPVPVPPPGFPALVGPCDNLLVLTADLGGGPTFSEVVDRAAAVLRAATRHRELPFARLVRELPVERDPRRVPFCDVLLALPGPEADLRLAGAGVVPTAVTDLGPTVADLAITVRSTWPTVAGTLSHRADRFATATAAGLLGQVRTLLSAALDAPHTPVHRLSLDGPALVGSTDGPRAEALPVHEIVRRRAGRTPEAVAVASRDGRWTYGELERRTAAVATYLRGLAVEGEPVAVRMTPGPWQLAASLGVLRAGGHLVWFGTGDAGRRGRAILSQLRPVCLLRTGEDPDDDLARWFRDELDGRLLNVTCLPRPSTTTAPAPTDDLTRTAYVAYASECAGRPAVIAHDHAALAQFVTWMADALELTPGARVAQWLAPEHAPSLCETVATLVGGGTLHPVPVRIRAHPEKLVDWLVRERITFLQTVPSVARELLGVLAAREPTDRPTSLRRLVLTGETLSDEVVNGFRRVLPATRLATVYGPAETIAATWHEITGPVPASVPIGRPIPGRQVLVLDEADQPCPTGLTGEIVVRSRYVCDGYLDDRDGEHDGSGDDSGWRRAVFRAPDGEPDDDTDLRWYRTGDLGRWRWDGLLELRGRRDPVEALPRSAAGEGERRRPPTPRSAAARRPVDSPVQRGLAEIWSALLGTGPFAADTSFFDAGGHSMLVPQLVQRIQRRFGVTVPLRECFTHHTLAGMIALVEAAEGRADLAAVAAAAP